MDAAYEPTGTYSRRVRASAAGPLRKMGGADPQRNVGFRCVQRDLPESARAHVTANAPDQRPRRAVARHAGCHEPVDQDLVGKSSSRANRRRPSSSRSAYPSSRKPRAAGQLEHAAAAMPAQPVELGERRAGPRHAGQIAFLTIRALMWPIAFVGFKPFGRLDAVHDAVAAEQPVGTVERVEALLRRLVAGVGEESPGLEQRGGSVKLLRVPPERRQAVAAAAAEDALVEPVQLVAILRDCRSPAPASARADQVPAARRGTAGRTRSCRRRGRAPPAARERPHLDRLLELRQA